MAVSMGASAPTVILALALLSFSTTTAMGQLLEDLAGEASVTLDL
jgi:hypothetical protein